MPAPPPSSLSGDVLEASGGQTTSAPSKPLRGGKGSPKMCEICNKQFEGKNRAMLKIQHMAHHFKNKLFADLLERAPPYKCPVDNCAYQV